VFAATATSQQARHYKYLSDGEPRMNDITVTGQSIIINYSLSELDLDNLTNDNGTFYRIAVPGHIHSSAVGKPELPVLSRMITIPAGYSAQIKLSDIRTTRLKPSLRRIRGMLYPAQESESKDPQQKKPPFALDKDVYSSRHFLKTDTVKIETLGTVRHKNLANVLISPVLYNPRSNTIEIITSMKIEINFIPSGSGESKALFRESALFSETLEKGLLNYNPGDLINGYTDKPVRMIILTDTAFRKGLEPYIRWKTQKGFRIEVLYKGASFAGNDYLSLKDTLASIYNSATENNPPPEYLLIVGDVNKVPYYGGGSYVTDMYYGEFDGNGDYFPEMYIGRLPVSNSTELKSVVSKIIQYEKFEFDSGNKFYENGLINAGSDDGHKEYMNGQVYYGITNYLTPANKINERHFYSEAYNAKDSIIKLINKGLSFINYTGHGDYRGWLHVNFKVGDTALLTNTNKYPFIIGNACETSTYNLSSIGNNLVLVKNKGAIGYIGCSYESLWDEDYFWAVGVGAISSTPAYETTGLGAYDRLFHTHGEQPIDWHISMGQVNFAGNLAVSTSTTLYKKRYWETYNLVGDPSIIPILGTPGTFSLALPDTLPNNIKTYTFTGEPFAYAAVSHFDTLWDASFLSPSGSVTLDMPGLSDDSCLVVVTGQNKKPVIKTIYFSSLNREFINLGKTGINDSPGNNNGLADYGETLYLKLTAGNLGTVPANNLRALISSGSEWVTILNDSAFIGTLAPGNEVTLNNKLQVRIAQNIPDNGIITFDLILRDNVTEKRYKADVFVHAPKLDILSYLIDDSQSGDGDMFADPGEIFNLRFNIRNSGTSNTSGTLNLSSPNSELSVLEPGKGSGLLEQGKTKGVSVMVKLSESVVPGTTISLSSLLNCDPYFANRSFAFRVGRIRESFESASFKLFPWINRSTKPWIITGSNSWDGISSARSGAITHSESTSLLILANYLAADSLKFYYNVSSERNYDFFVFKLNDVKILEKSGEITWQKAIIPVPAGYNKLEWIFKKDQSVSSGSDCAMIDMIDFAGPGTVNYIGKDIVTARIVSPVNKDNLEREPVTLRVLNIGPDTINGFNMAYTINNGSPVSQYFNDNLIPFGDSVTVTFNTAANLSRYGSYDITAYGFNNNDDYLLNDTLKVNIRNNELDGPLQVTPNPFTNELQIVLNSEFEGAAQFSLYNTTGKILWKKHDYPVTAGTNALTLDDLPPLAPAVYYLKVEFPGFSKTVHLVKIKQ